mgnify:FL=1
MVIKLSELVSLYRLNIRGVLHIGAHYGEELDFYLACGVKHMLFVEPLPDNYRHLLDRFRPLFEPFDAYPAELSLHNASKQLNIKALNLALGNSTGILPMYVETVNQSQSSSLLKPKKHLEQYPHITFDDKVDVKLDKLDNLLLDPIYNMLNIDVQGFELEVFKGGSQTLARQIDYIYTEVNRDELYENCCMIEELDKYLGELGFERMITDWVGGTWGDALYIKKQLAPGKLRQRIIRFGFTKRGRKLFRLFGRKRCIG